MKVEAEEMPQLETKLQESNSRLCFLVDYVTFSLTDIQLNSKTFQCHARMPSVFDQHREIIKEKTNQFQNGLKVLQMSHAGQSAQTTLKTIDQTKPGNIPANRHIESSHYATLCTLYSAYKNNN